MATNAWNWNSLLKPESWLLEKIMITEMCANLQETTMSHWLTHPFCYIHLAPFSNSNAPGQWKSIVLGRVLVPMTRAQINRKFLSQMFEADHSNICKQAGLQQLLLRVIFRTITGKPDIVITQISLIQFLWWYLLMRLHLTSTDITCNFIREIKQLTSFFLQNCLAWELW